MKIAACHTPFNLVIRRSKIDGNGVFAQSPIPRGRKVIAYAGEKITRKEALRRVKKKLRRKRNFRTYFFGLNRYWVIDASLGGNGAERINHCCDPTLFTRKANGQVFFYSRRRIRKGEELSLDYRFKEEHIKIPCHCGSPKCRGFMNRRLRT
jgi:SET domain-containing protein